jgi:hypothetical protein
VSGDSLLVTVEEAGGGSGDTSIRRCQGGVVRRLAGMEGAELADMAEAEVGGG